MLWILLLLLISLIAFLYIFSNEQAKLKIKVPSKSEKAAMRRIYSEIRKPRRKRRSGAKTKK